MRDQSKGWGLLKRREEKGEKFTVEEERVQRFEWCSWVTKLESPIVGNPKPTL